MKNFVICKDYWKKFAHFVILVVKIAVACTIVAKMLSRFYYVTAAPRATVFSASRTRDNKKKSPRGVNTNKMCDMYITIYAIVNMSYHARGSICRLDVDR